MESRWGCILRQITALKLSIIGIKSSAWPRTLFTNNGQFLGHYLNHNHTVLILQCRISVPSRLIMMTDCPSSSTSIRVGALIPFALFSTDCTLSPSLEMVRICKNKTFAVLVLISFNVQTSIQQTCRIFTNKHNKRNQLFSTCDRTPV